MKIKNYITGSVLFFAIMACVVPGLSQPAAPSAFDPDSISTMVVLTANALASQTAAATTPLPPETPTPTLLPTETATPKISLSGTSLLLRDDQTTVFTDHRTGIELIIPAGWLAVRVNESEYYDAWVLPELSDPAFQRLLTNMRNLNPNESRLFALDVQEGHLQDGFVTNINLFWNENEEMSLENDTDLQEAADSITLPDLDILTIDVSVTSGGIPIGVITSKRSGTPRDAFHKLVFVSARKGTLLITLTTTEDLTETILSTFDAMIETMTQIKE